MDEGIDLLLNDLTERVEHIRWRRGGRPAGAPVAS
jgi:hypothetical protein